MGFGIDERTKVISFEKSEARYLEEYLQGWIKDNPGCEILDWKQSGDGKGYTIITIFYNPRSKELDELLG